MQFAADWLNVCGETEKRNKIRVANHGIQIWECETSKHKTVSVITQQISEIFIVTDHRPDEDVKTYRTYSNEINAHVTIIVSRYNLGMWHARPVWR